MPNYAFFQAISAITNPHHHHHHYHRGMTFMELSSLFKAPSSVPKETPSCCPLFSAVSLVLMGHAKNVNNNFICLSICIFSCVPSTAFLTLRLEVVPSTHPHSPALSPSPDFGTQKKIITMNIISMSLARVFKTLDIN